MPGQGHKAGLVALVDAPGDAAGHIPQVQGVVSRSRQELAAVVAESDTQNDVLVAVEWAKRYDSLEIPEHHLLVMAGRCQVDVVWA